MSRDGAATQPVSNPGLHLLKIYLFNTPRWQHTVTNVQQKAHRKKETTHTMSKKSCVLTIIAVKYDQNRFAPPIRLRLMALYKCALID